jgi:hypothetical protein
VIAHTPFTGPVAPPAAAVLGLVDAEIGDQIRGRLTISGPGLDADEQLIDR